MRKQKHPPPRASGSLLLGHALHAPGQLSVKSLPPHCLALDNPHRFALTAGEYQRLSADTHTVRAPPYLHTVRGYGQPKKQ
jgi:hypothetical protein